MKKHVILLLIMVSLASANQPVPALLNGNVSGLVLDESTTSPLIGVNILVEGTQQGAAADQDGQFLIENLQAGIYNLRVLMLGYETRVLNNIVVNPGRTTFYKIELKPTVLETEEISITAGYFHEAKDAVVSNRSVDYEEIRLDPGSSEDIQRVMQVLPAVVSGADQDNEIIVRGGMPGENLFIMDQIEIPNPNHFGHQGFGGGPINMLNAQMVRRVDFYAGAFPARYGDKASSVMDISLRDGDRKQFTGHGYLGMSGAGFTIEGPIQGGKGSYILSARKSFLDLIISSTGLTAVPKYYNLQGRAVYDLNKNNQLIFNGIYGNDNITIEAEEEESGYSRGAENVKSLSHQYAYGVTLKTLYGSKGFSRITASQTLNNWDQDVYDEHDITYYINQSTEIENTLKADLTYIPIKNIELNVGGHYKNIPVDIREWVDKDTTFIYDISQNPAPISGIHHIFEGFSSDFDETTYKTAAYGQVKWSPVHYLTTTVGMRADYFGYIEKGVVDPRFGISYSFMPKTSLNLAVGQQSQSPSYIQMISHPNNKNLDYKKTQQVVLGLEHLFREDVRGTVEVFYKDYSQVPIPITFLTPDPFDISYGEMVSKGKGFAKGIELFLQKKMVENFYYTLSYSFSRSFGFDPRYDKTYAWDYDYGHVFTATSGVRFNLLHKKWYQNLSQNFLYKFVAWASPLGDEMELSFRYRYLGGRPYTQPTYYPHIQSWIVDETREFNTERYPEYHRLDFRLDRRFMFDGWNIVTYLDIMNVYGQKNIWQYSYNSDGTVENIYQFEVFPVGGFTIEF